MTLIRNGVNCMDNINLRKTRNRKISKFDKQQFKNRLTW